MFKEIKRKRDQQIIDEAIIQFDSIKSICKKIINETINEDDLVFNEGVFDKIKGLFKNGGDTSKSTDTDLEQFRADALKIHNQVVGITKMMSELLDKHNNGNKDVIEFAKIALQHLVQLETATEIAAKGEITEPPKEEPPKEEPPKEEPPKEEPPKEEPPKLELVPKDEEPKDEEPSIDVKANESKWKRDLDLKLAGIVSKKEDIKTVLLTVNDFISKIGFTPNEIISDIKKWKLVKVKRNPAEVNEAKSKSNPKVKQPDSDNMITVNDFLIKYPNEHISPENMKTLGLSEDEKFQIVSEPDGKVILDDVTFIKKAPNKQTMNIFLFVSEKSKSIFIGTGTQTDMKLKI